MHAKRETAAAMAEARKLKRSREAAQLQGELRNICSALLGDVGSRYSNGFRIASLETTAMRKARRIHLDESVRSVQGIHLLVANEAGAWRGRRRELEKSQPGCAARTLRVSPGIYRKSTLGFAMASLLSLRN